MEELSRAKRLESSHIWVRRVGALSSCSNRHTTKLDVLQIPGFTTAAYIHSSIHPQQSLWQSSATLQAVALSLGSSHEPHLACVSLFLTFVHSISQKVWGIVHLKSEVWLLFLLRDSFSMDLLEAAPVFTLVWSWENPLSEVLIYYLF